MDPLFDLDEPFGVQLWLPLPKPGRVPIITEEDLDKVDSRMGETETRVLRTLPPGTVKDRARNDLRRARQEIAKLRKLIDDPNTSERDLFDGIQNLHTFEEHYKRLIKQERTARVVNRFLKKL